MSASNEVPDLIRVDRSEEGEGTGRLLTELGNGRQWVVGTATLPDTGGIDPDAIARSRTLLAEDRSERFESASGPIFIQVFNPPFRLILVDAVHIAQPLAQFADLAGYDVLVIDPRAAFAEIERFAGLSVDRRWPDEALAKIKGDPRTALVTLTHDPKLDDPALDWALRTPAFYIGAPGQPEDTRKPPAAPRRARLFRGRWRADPRTGRSKYRRGDASLLLDRDLA